MIDDEAVTRAVTEFEKNYVGSRLDFDRIMELIFVRQMNYPRGNEVSKQLLHALLIVAYPDRGLSTWYDAHPITWETIEMWEKH